MTTTESPAKAPAKKRRKAASRPAGTPVNGSNGHTPAAFTPPTQAPAAAPAEEFVPTTTPEQPAPAAAPVEELPAHPYGDVKLFMYRPKDGSPPIVFPHISTCIPDALFLYDNRNKDELRQCFAWMDRAGVPDDIGRRVWVLPPSEQAEIVSGWFSGLVVNGPEGVSPPGEF